MNARIHTTMARINVLLTVANVLFLIGAVGAGHIFGAIAAGCFAAACGCSVVTHAKQALMLRRIEAMTL